MQQNEVNLKVTLEGAAQASSEAAKLSTEIDAIGKTAEGASPKVFRFADGLGELVPKGAAAAAGADRVSEAVAGIGRQAGVSAKQTAAAFRTLPAQMTDIATQLAGGASPLLVLMQQGGQIKDSFGGVGNTVRALAGAITPVGAAVAGVVTTVGALAAAYALGSKEADEYRRALLLTGNAAGTTASQMQGMAETISQVVGTQAKAAEVLAMLAASGLVAAGHMGRLAEAAIRLEREGGPAVEKTVAAFAELAKDPLKASLKLNESTNFLTMALYRQITALTEHGRAAEAAQLAQSAYATEMTSRAKTLEANLGTLESAWRAVGDGAKWAWDKMLNIGRPDTLEQQLSDLQAKLAVAEAAPEGQRSAARIAFIADAKQRIEALRLQIYTTMELGQAEADRAATVRGAAAADAKAKEAAKAANEEAQRRAALVAELSGLERGYTEDLKRLHAMRQGGVLTEKRYVELVGELIAKQPFAKKQAEELAKADQKRAKAQEEVTKAAMDSAGAIAKELAAGEQTLRSLADQIDVLTLSKAAILDKKAAQLELTATIYDQASAQALLDGLTVGESKAYAERARQIREEIALRRQLFGAEQQKESADAASKAWQATADDIRGALTDSFRRAFEAGDSAGEAFAKSLGNEVKVRMLAALADVMATQTLAFIIGTGAQGGGGSGSGSTLQGINTAGTLYQIYNGQGVLGSGVGYLASTNAAYGAAIGTTNVGAGSQAAMLAAQTGEFGTAGTVATSQAAAGAGSGAASWASVAGWVAAAVLGAMKASSDYSEGFNSSGSRQVSKDTGVYAFGGYEADRANLFKKFGMGDRLADILSGSTAVAKILGYSSPSIRNPGVAGTISAGDFTGTLTAEQVQKAGIINKIFGGGDKVTPLTSALPDDLGRFLDDAASAIYSKAKDFGQALGLPAEKLSDITTEIKVKLTDDGEANVKAIAEALGGYGDKLVASWADAVAPLATYGETTVQTIERVGGAIQSVNQVLDTLGLKALSASIDGGKAALALEGLFGGLQGLQQAAGSYLQNFYTDAERAALTTKALTAEFERYGATLPTTRAEFRALVDAQDLTTEGGRRAFAALMSVADAFASVVPEAVAVADAVDTAAAAAAAAAEDMARAAAQMAEAWNAAAGNLAGGVLSAYSTVASQIQNERQRVESDAQTRIDALQRQADGALQAFNRIRDGLVGLIDAAQDRIDAITGTLARDGGRALAEETIRNAMASARNGRPLDVDAIRGALGNFSNVSKSGFTNAVDYGRELGRTAQVLRDVQGAATRRVNVEGAQLSAVLASIASQQVAIEADRDAQLKVLDDQLAQARKDAGSLVSIDEGVQTVAQAIAALADAIGAMSLAGGGSGPTGRWLTSGSQQVYGSTGGAVAIMDKGGTIASALIRGRQSTFTGAAAQAWVAASLAAGDVRGVYDRAQAEGISLSDLNGLNGWQPGTAEAVARDRGWPIFGYGGLHAGGVRLVGDRGPELEATGPARIYSFDQLMQMASGGAGGDTAQAVRELRDEVSALRRESSAQQLAIARHTSKFSSLADRWEGAGMPPTRS